MLALGFQVSNVSGCQSQVDTQECFQIEPEEFGIATFKFMLAPTTRNNSFVPEPG